MAILEALDLKIARLRNRGYKGTPILPHRSIYHIPLNWGDVLLAVLLPLVFNLLLLVFLDELVAGWSGIMRFWLGRMLPGAGVKMSSIDLGSFVLVLPIPDLFAGAPGPALWWSTLLACVLLFLASGFIPAARYLPLKYLLRALLLIQATALVYFLLLPASFPYDLAVYLTDAAGMSLLFLFIAPWILGMTYAIFDFSLLQKIALMTVVVAYFWLALPMQYLLHAMLLHWGTLLFLPICYLAFGIFLDVMMFVALYAWGMSWRFRRIGNAGAHHASSSGAERKTAILD